MVQDLAEPFGAFDVRALQFNSDGLIPAVAQDADTKEVLMLAWMNAESLRRTFDLGETVFWSRSRHEYWHKGATSGNTQRVVDLLIDCDGDTLLIDEILCYRGADSCQPNELRLHRRGEDDPIATGTWQSCSGSRGVREAIATTAEFQAMIEAIFSG